MSLKDLPIYDIVIGDNVKNGVGFISLVDEPAIGVDWIKLAKEKPLMFKSDRDKQLLYGPFLIPNMLIYRSDEVNGEYYVRFSKEEIEKIATKFSEDMNAKNINLMHTDKKVDGFVVQNWIIESDQDKSRGLGFDLPEGTWFGAVKIKDTDFWNDKVKNEEVKGFSVEILADLELALKNKKQEMKKDLKFKKRFIGKQKFDEAVEVTDGELIVVAEEIAVGEEIVVVMDDLTVVESYDGDIVIDGETVVVEAGVITEVNGDQEPSNDEAIEEDLEEDGKVGSDPMSPEEVSQMIDARFAELMEEITKIKSQMDGEIAEEFKKIDEKFKLTPGTEPIKKSNVDENFRKTEERLRAFMKG